MPRERDWLDDALARAIAASAEQGVQLPPELVSEISRAVLEVATTQLKPAEVDAVVKSLVQQARSTR